MAYAVKEIFLSLQGEGHHAGRVTIFCRFAGCNLWSGLEKHRFKAKCRFCDTDFVGTDGTYGDKYKTAQELAGMLYSLWPQAKDGTPYVVFTGGEPMLQLDKELIEACKKLGFEIGLETNGTKVVVEGVDWICVSPKPRSKLIQKEGHELKLIYPQEESEMAPHHFQNLEFQYFYLQPMDGIEGSVQQTIDYCLTHPQWKLSLQSHKLLGLR